MSWQDVWTWCVCVVVTGGMLVGLVWVGGNTPGCVGSSKTTDIHVACGAACADAGR